MLNGSSNGLTRIELEFLESQIQMARDISSIAASLKSIADSLGTSRETAGKTREATGYTLVEAPGPEGHDTFEPHPVLHAHSRGAIAAAINARFNLHRKQDTPPLGLMPDMVNPGLTVDSPGGLIRWTVEDWDCTV